MVEAHHDQMNRCVEFGDQLVDNEHFAAKEIQNNVAELQELWLNVEKVCSQRKEQITQCYELQVHYMEYSLLSRFYFNVLAF